jgi:putative lysine transport system permease protein
MSLFEQIGYLFQNKGILYLEGIASTVVLSVFGTVVGLFLGIFLALGERIHIHSHAKWYTKAWQGLIKGFCYIYSVVIRGTPMMVQAMIFYFGCVALGLNWNAFLVNAEVFDGMFFAGLIIITFNTAAYMGEIVKSGLNGVDAGQIEGARSLGLSRNQAMFSVALPQAIKNSIPTIGNEWVVNIKDSSVLNVIGVTELYFRAGQASNKNYFIVATYVIIAITYLILTLLTNGILYLTKIKMDGKKINFGFHHFASKKVA